MITNCTQAAVTFNCGMTDVTEAQKKYQVSPQMTDDNLVFFHSNDSSTIFWEFIVKTHSTVVIEADQGKC